MKYKYDAVIFDLDGTLLDTSEGIIKAVEYTIRKYNLNKLTNDQLLSFIGPPIQESFNRMYNFDEEKCQRLAETFRERYKTIDLLKAKPYNGIYELLNHLLENNIKIAVSTYKREDYAKTLLDAFEFNKYFNIINGADNYNKLKKKDIIKLSINDCKINNNSKVVYIGDTQSDLNASKELEINFIGVNYGFGFKNVNSYANKPNDILLYMR